MDKWNLDLGVICLWRDEDKAFHKAYTKISYDISDELPFQMKSSFEDVNEIISQKSKELVIENKDTGVTILNDDTTCILTVEQKVALFSVPGIWEHQPLNPPITKVIDRGPGVYAEDFGIIHYYDSDKEQFVKSNLMIEYDWDCSEPIAMFVRTYDENMFPEKKINAQLPNINYKYEGKTAGLSHYEFFGHHFLFTSKQEKHFINIMEMFNKRINWMKNNF